MWNISCRYDHLSSSDHFSNVVSGTFHERQVAKADEMLGAGTRPQLSRHSDNHKDVS